MRFTWKRAPLSMESYQPRTVDLAVGRGLAALGRPGAATICLTSWVLSLRATSTASGVSTITASSTADAGRPAVLGIRRVSRLSRRARRPATLPLPSLSAICPEASQAPTSDQPATWARRSRDAGPSAPRAFHHRVVDGIRRAGDEGVRIHRTKSASRARLPGFGAGLGHRGLRAPDGLGGQVLARTMK